MSNKKTEEGIEWWRRFCQLPTFSFIKTGEFDSVTAWENDGGLWVEHYSVSVIVDEMQKEIRELKSEVNALKNRQAMKAV